MKFRMSRSEACTGNLEPAGNSAAVIYPSDEPADTYLGFNDQHGLLSEEALMTELLASAKLATRARRVRLPWSRIVSG